MAQPKAAAPCRRLGQPATVVTRGPAASAAWPAPGSSRAIAADRGWQPLNPPLTDLVSVCNAGNCIPVPATTKQIPAAPYSSLEWLPPR